MATNKSKDDSPSEITPAETKGARRTVIAVGIAVLIIFLAVLAWYAVWVLLVFFAGVLLAIFWRSLAEALSYWTGMSVGWALGAVVAAMVVISALLAWLLLARISTQISELAERLPLAFEHLRRKLEMYPVGQQLLLLGRRLNLASLARPELLGTAGGVLSTALGGVVTIVVMLFLGIYLAMDPQLYIGGVVSLFPRGYRARVYEIFDAVGYTLRWWIIGQAIDMLAIGVVTALGLWIIGVPLALTLGLMAAVFNIIPNFGPFFSFIPAMLLAVTVSPGRAMWVILLYIVAQSLEGYVLQPMIQRQAVRLPPALTITAQVLMGLLLGVVGLALAAPLAAATLVIVKMVYVQDVLGEEES